MILTANRGQAFSENFNFKDASGQPLAPPFGNYSLALGRGDFVKEFPNLVIYNGVVVWKMTPAQVNELKYSTLYFTLTFNGKEITRGVLRVQ